MGIRKKGLFMLFLAALSVSVLLVFWPPRQVIADEVYATNTLPTTEDDWRRLEPRQYLYLRYPEVANKIDRIIKCEGAWRMVPNSQGLSTAFGYAQFLNGTWLETRRRMGLSIDLESRKDPYAHIDATVFLWDNGKGASHWSESFFCWR